MAAEHALDLPQTGVQNSAGSDFVGESEPSSVQAIRQSRDILAFEIQFLEIQMH